MLRHLEFETNILIMGDTLHVVPETFLKMAPNFAIPSFSNTAKVQFFQRVPTTKILKTYLFSSEICSLKTDFAIRSFTIFRKFKYFSVILRLMEKTFSFLKHFFSKRAPIFLSHYDPE